MKKENNGKLRIIPLGGLEQIGMNITAFEYEDSIIVVDCGLAFPEDDMLGIDLVIPDVSYLKDHIEKVKGFVITHGHEDHIGALPYVLKEMNLPIYTTKLTMGIIENKLKEHNLLRTTRRRVVHHGQSINLGQFRIEFIKTNHSIQDASALAIYSPAGTVVHTGDFKVDYTPVFGDAIDLQRFAEIGKKGVLALMSDSTNAERKGFTQSERTVGITFDHIFAEHQNTRIIIATFASNVDRVQQVINSAYKYGRKVVVEGRSMVNIISTASELGYLNVPDGGGRAPEGDDPADGYDYFQFQSDSGKREVCFPRDQRAVCKGSKCDLPGGPCIRTCLPGGIKADLLPCKTEVRHPGTRRIPSSEGQFRGGAFPGDSQGEYLHHPVRRRAGAEQ